MTGYANAYQRFLVPAGIVTEHKKKLDNLANFLASTGAAYAIGDYSSQMAGLTVKKLLDMLEAISETTKWLKVKPVTFKDLNEDLITFDM
jgi:hypothetical protein